MIDDQLAQRFRCPKCRNQGGQVKRIAATGTGLSRWFNVQLNHFITVSCSRCGFTEMYNPEILEGKRSGAANVLDVIFGS